jgi:hypothetical protein
MITKWATDVRQWPWWRWLALAGCLAIAALDTVSVHFSSHADWRQHLRLFHIAYALTGLEIFVGLPLLHLAPRRHEADLRTQWTSEAEPDTDPDG